MHLTTLNIKNIEECIVMMHSNRTGYDNLRVRLLNFLKQNQQYSKAIIENDKFVGFALIQFNGFNADIFQLLIEQEYNTSEFISKVLSEISQELRLIGAKNMTIQTTNFGKKLGDKFKSTQIYNIQL